MLQQSYGGGGSQSYNDSYGQQDAKRARVDASGTSVPGVGNDAAAMAAATYQNMMGPSATCLCVFLVAWVCV